jgi:cytochrome c-type biogenesis protein
MFIINRRRGASAALRGEECRRRSALAIPERSDVKASEKPVFLFGLNCRLGWRNPVSEKGTMYLQEAVTAFSVGLLASLSPCVLPLYPGFLAYLSGGQLATTSRRRYFLGFFVLAGVLVMMLLLGVLIALLSISIGTALRWVVPISDIIIIGLGVLLIFNANPFKTLPQIRIPRCGILANAFVHGLLYGLLTLPCSGPLIVSIFALSLSAGEALSRLSVFLWFD